MSNGSHQSLGLWTNKFFRASLHLALISCFLFTACASRLTDDNFRKIKNGMSEEEVKAILGNPTKVETGETLGIRGTTYTYSSGNSEARVVFLNSSVMSKDGSFK